MFKLLYYQVRLSIRNDAGKAVKYLKLPYKTENLFEFLICCLKLAAFFAFKILYVFLFMLMPCVLFARFRGAAGFQLTESMVYFTAILTCVCGSLINSAIFEMDEDTYVMLATLRMKPAVFFKGRLLVKLLADGVGFYIAYLIMGMGAGEAFYLTIWIILSRVIGEAINLYVFRYTGKPIQDLPVVSMIIMAVSVFGAYGFSYLRGHVPDFTKFVYDYVWLTMALLVGAIIIYGLLIYDGYSYVAKRFINNIENEIGEVMAEEKDAMDILANDIVTDTRFKTYEKDSARGYEYIHKIFFSRNMAYIKNTVFVRIVIVVIAAVVGVVICALSNETVNARVWEVMCESLPLMVFVMFCLSATPNICKAMFYHIDCNMLVDKRYGRGGRNFCNFLIRLKRVVCFDVAIGAVVCAALAVIAYATGNGASVEALLPVYAGIIMLSIFFAVFNLAVYYLCQPYNKEMKIKNYMYYVANIGMLAVAYGCVYIDVNPIMFNVGLGLVLSVLFAVAATLVYKVSGKTFRVQ